MSIDFEIPTEAKAIREKVRKFVHDECIPAEKELDSKGFDDVLAALRKKARAQGLWNPFVPKQYGGMGATLNEQIIMTEELAHIGAPQLPARRICSVDHSASAVFCAFTRSTWSRDSPM